MIIDGGNAHFADTRRREKALRERGLHFVGTGISGGEEGALNGPSIMPGGSAEAYARSARCWRTSPPRSTARPAAPTSAPTAPGHFVKMVHNGIEYADMQLIAEAYDLLRRVAGLRPRPRSRRSSAPGTTGRLESYLIEITAEVLAHVDAATGKPFVDVVADQAEQKGTGRWTVQTALDLGVPVTGIAEAVFARSLSGHAELRAAAPGAARRAGAAARRPRPRGFVDEVEQALYASKIVAYAQGFDQIQAGSDEYGWDIDLGAVATIWRGGCIIRARFLDRIRAGVRREPDAGHACSPTRSSREALGDAQDAWRRVVAAAARPGVPAPGLLGGAGVLRRPARRAAARRADPGAARLLRRPHLPAGRPRGPFHTLWAEEGRPKRSADAQGASGTGRFTRPSGSTADVPDVDPP